MDYTRDRDVCLTGQHRPLADYIVFSSRCVHKQKSGKMIYRTMPNYTKTYKIKLNRKSVHR